MQKKQEPFYRTIIADAWRIAWEHKHLWIFGFFATFLRFGGVTELFFNSYDRHVQAVPNAVAAHSPATLLPGVKAIQAIIQYSHHPVFSSLLFMAISVLIFFVFAWIATVSLGGLLSSAKKISRGSHPQFADGVRDGMTSFWPVFWINLLAKIAIGATMAMTAITLFVQISDRSWVSALFYGIAFIVFAAAAISVSLAAVYASCFAVIKGQRTGPAITESFKLLRRHWLVSFEMLVVLFLVNLIVSIAALAAIAVLSVPFVFLFLLALAYHSGPLIFTVTSMVFVSVGVAGIALTSFLTTLEVSAWTLLWTELTERVPVSKLLRVVTQWRSSMKRA